MKTLFNDVVYYISGSGTIWKLDNGKLFYKWGSEWFRRYTDWSQDEQILREWLRMKAVKEVPNENAV